MIIVTAPLPGGSALDPTSLRLIGPTGLPALRGWVKGSAVAWERGE
jgi:hypothetical protein